ncbi:hypothetical protein JQ557_28605 [Bradyrhizobium sp. U87765 SZCCT0131]|uniref:hypothetical protein n=1 Tax=unclassified Bradyrhizobium TaxID=2631580 RepID=UPI001BA8417D|nr:MULTISPECIES: hypothetical protein [unclassified Bradyrhizobium]MBR1221994.1 hypothetical protein [Bradyrhizobium sp. U87765 SZCCT0131]MBR1263808.1 hypothetical protein [Bradyrhizobium sp. U87765 SZCCT0134]MBR1302622.1 hypothetical protein [Bradyrhizobium sp. U87765 SZCCT0110]MBR1320058.1 hypothetical protein [Bradyrhizobium sp. U87765 SZCCT0109]MBR1348829.1 hypothetical protein [Bradyrhizobium sp. U87765 SZCCT0048]
MSRIISGWIVAMAGFSGTAVLMAGAAQAQTRVADEIRAPYPDTVIIRRGPYAPPPLAGAGHAGPRDTDGDEEAVPPFQVVRIIRATGFEPLGPPVRRRWVYTISAINPDGDDGRVVLDAHTGRIVRFLPAEVSDAEVVGAYGPPGLPQAPPRSQRADVHSLRPPLPVPKVASRTPPPLPAPKPEAAKVPAAEPRTVGAAVPVQQQAAAPAAARAAVQLQPTQDMPPVQGFE